MTTQSGQVGIAVLLIMVVLSTIGISIATRSSQDIQSSRQNQEASQTFTAAESALENVLAQGQQYLQDNQSGQFKGVENATVDYTIQQNGSIKTEILQGAVAEVDVSTSQAGDVVRIEWSNTIDCAKDPASLAITVMNSTDPAVSVARNYTFAVCDRGDGFSLVNTPGSIFMRRVDLVLQAGDKYVRIVPVYSDTQLSVNGVGWTLPTQEFIINSVAKNDLGRETKAIEVQRSLDFAPSIFDFSLVSGTSILK